MRALIKGEEGKNISLPKGADIITAIPIMIINDTGTVHDLSTATVDLVVYDRTDRTSTVIATLPITVATAAAGVCTLTAAVAAMNFGPGNYYGFVRKTLTGVITWSRRYITLTIT